MNDLNNLENKADSCNPDTNSLDWVKGTQVFVKIGEFGFSDSKDNPKHELRIEINKWFNWSHRIVLGYTTVQKQPLTTLFHGNLHNVSGDDIKMLIIESERLAKGLYARNDRLTYGEAFGGAFKEGLKQFDSKEPTLTSNKKLFGEEAIAATNKTLVDLLNEDLKNVIIKTTPAIDPDSIRCEDENYIYYFDKNFRDAVSFRMGIGQPASEIFDFIFSLDTGSTNYAERRVKSKPTPSPKFTPIIDFVDMKRSCLEIWANHRYSDNYPDVLECTGFSNNVKEEFSRLETLIAIAYQCGKANANTKLTTAN